jgi:hypothetical protein
MSLFKDTNAIYSENWHSSPWKNYYYKPKSRVVEASSGDNVDLTIWGAEEEWIGKRVTLQATHATGSDYIGSFTVDGQTITSDRFLTGTQASGKPDCSASTVGNPNKFWFAPGIGFQLPSGTHATSTFTQTTSWNTFIEEGDIGEKVFDGGIHCWMSYPYETVASGSSDAEKYPVSKPIPYEYIGNNQALFIFNSMGHQTRRFQGNVQNVGLEVDIQYSMSDNPGLATDSSDWTDSGIILMGDIDVEDNTGDGSTGVNSVYMMRNRLDYTTEGFKQARIRWYNKDVALSTECRLLRNQFVMISLYPMRGVEE